MKIYVINLPTSPDRREFQRSQLARLGLTFEFVRAFRPEDLCQSELATLAQSWERPMLAREVACFLSHRALWERIAAGAEPALILEDDALLADAAPAVLDELSRVVGLDRANLEARGRRKIVCRRPVALGNSHHRVRVFLDRSGAAGYVLWPSGAVKMLEHFNGNAALADKALCLQQLRADQVEPALGTP